MAFYVTPLGGVLEFEIHSPDEIKLSNGAVLKDTNEVSSRLFASRESADKFAELVREDPRTAERRFNDWLEEKGRR